LKEKAFQDTYPDHLSHCYGCGRLNEYGMQIKSYWDGDETVAKYQPQPHQTSIPGYAYGGLIASLIDCHSTGTASAAAYREAERPMGSDPPLRHMTASLHVDYYRPTPIGAPIELRSIIKEVKGRKVIVETQLSSEGKICARGEVVAVLTPEHLLDELTNS
jgi:acyl-coenzyme A thioesterase PaaI-like protein